MIKFENIEVVGWEHAIRGMRNPKNSWQKSDSYTCYATGGCHCEEENYIDGVCHGVTLGENDHDLMMTLRNAGTDHRKFMRMIVVYADVIAPLYWWKEFDTYKVGTVANSCSTMHKIHTKEFELEDFSTDHLNIAGINCLKTTITALNNCRSAYVEDGEFKENKEVWWQMIQLLPSSYNQTRNVMMNYEVLANIYTSRKNHKLNEWCELCSWVKTLPYQELITGGN